MEAVGLRLELPFCALRNFSSHGRALIFILSHNKLQNELHRVFYSQTDMILENLATKWLSEK